MGDIVSDRAAYERMLQLLQTFDENIYGINVINDECLLSMRNHSKSLPLSIFGEGIKKAADLLAAAISARKGILLIDEFETSIHPSAIAGTLSWVIRTALANDTQVFLSTHSTETLQAICDLDDEMKKRVNFYTLYCNGSIGVRKLDGITAGEVARMGVSLL